MVRPIIVGIVVDPQVQSVLRAIHAATSCWGGMYFPLLSSTLGDDDLATAAGRYGVDAIVRMAEDGSTKSFERIGFAFGGNSPYGPFDDQPSYATRRLQHVGPLISHRDATFSTPGLIIVPGVRPDEEPATLADAARWGAYGDDEVGTMLRNRYFGAGYKVPTGLDARPASPSSVTPVTLTASMLEHTADPLGTGIAVLDLDEPVDVIDFWNLRAGNARVQAWPVDATEETKVRVSTWLRNLASDLPTWRRGGKNPREFPVVTVWHREGVAIPDEVSALVESVGAELRSHEPHPHDRLPRFRPPHLISTDLRMRFDEEIDPTDLQMRVDVPTAELTSTQEEAGRVAVQVSVDHETRWPRDLVACIPGVRPLAAVYQPWQHYIASPVIRPGYEGPVVTADTWTGEASIPILIAENVVAALMEDSQWDVGRSDAGQFSTQVVDLFGGLRTLQANQPATRGVLRKLGRTTHGLPHAALVSEANRLAAEWSVDPIFDTPVERYAEKVIGQLLEAGIVIPYLKLGCPYCRNSSEWEVGELTEQMTCRLCRRTFRPGVALVLGADHDRKRWRYGLARHLDPDELRSALAVVATLEMLEQMSPYSPMSVTQLGVELRVAGRAVGDIDILRLGMFQHAPTAFVCEVKAGAAKQLDDQLRLLTEVQTHLRSLQLECIVGLSTLELPPTGDDLHAMRAFVEQSPTRLHGMQQRPCLPLVLTRHQIDARPRTYGLFQWVEPPNDPLEEALRQNLGLVSIEPVGVEGWSYTWE